MNYKTKIFCFLSICICFFSSCNAFKPSCEKYFKVQDAYYQSWVKNENEKGTHITIILKNIKPDVEFDSMIFRGRQMPVSIENKENTIILTSTTLSIIPELTDGSTPVSKPDQILFKIKGERHNFLLKKVRREKMKYY